MKIGILAGVLLSILALPARAADDPKAIVDKAIKALGGEEALGKIKAFSWKAKTTVTFGGNELEGSSEVTAEGLNHYRQQFAGERDGNKFTVLSLLNGEKGSRTFGGNTTDLDKDGLANQKRVAYLSVIPVTLLALRDKEFKLESIAEEKVGDKPAAGIKVTAPDGKDFKLYFDRESGLPVKLVAKVMGFMNMEYEQQTTFADYKDVAGIKKAMKVENKRNGEPFQKFEITEFKVLDKVEAKVFEG